jgi:hypothetical protein
LGVNRPTICINIPEDRIYYNLCSFCEELVLHMLICAFQIVISGKQWKNDFGKPISPNYKGTEVIESAEEKEAHSKPHTEDGEIEADSALRLEHYLPCSYLSDNSKGREHVICFVFAELMPQGALADLGGGDALAFAADTMWFCLTERRLYIFTMNLQRWVMPTAARFPHGHSPNLAPNK